MVRKKLRIGFIGAGSIGSLFGGYLANIRSKIYELEVIFFSTREHAEAINKDGLRIQKKQEVKKINEIIAYENEKFIKETMENDYSYKFDYLFLTTKTYDIKKAIIQYKEILDASNWLVILQNGVGNEDIISIYLSKSKLIRAVTSNGAFLKSPGNLIHTGDGITKIGFPFFKAINSNQEKVEKAYLDLTLLKELLELAGFKTVIVKDIVKESWEKVFVNVGINAFGALTNLKNGQLLEFEGIKKLMGEAINEAIQVAKMRDVNLSNKDFIAEAYRVAKNTSENKNSMLQDILNGLPTEIDFINGRVLTYAKELGIKVPINEILTYLIKGLERP
ncbi:MAG: ketopantoate reductase family protein [Promethearchaeota archaeon]